MDSNELDAVDTLHFLTIYLERGMCGLPGCPKVHNDPLGFCGVQDQIIVRTPLDLMSDLLSVVCLLIVGCKSHYGGVISKPHYSVRGVDGVEVIGEESEEGLCSGSGSRMCACPF